MPAEQPDDAVRRLLADARHDEPLPPDVAERLDTLLGRLVEQRVAAAPVDELAARRQQRHRRRSLLLVAAAVAAVVVGTGGVLGQLGSRSGSDDAGSASSSADSAGQATDPQAEDQDAPSSSDGASTLEQAPAAPVAPQQLDELVTLTSAGFDDEVAAVLAQRRTSSSDAYGSSLTLLLDDCPLPAGAPTGAGTTTLPATYDGVTGLLVAAAPSGGSREVSLYACGEPTPERTTEVPVQR